MNTLKVTVIFICSITSIFSQNISLVQDLRTGSTSGIATGSISFNDEIYFIGQNDGPSLLTVFSLSEDGVIRERVTGDGFDQAAKLVASGNHLYVVFTSGFDNTVYRTNGTNGNKQLVFESEEDVSQLVSLEEGIVVLEEDFSGIQTVSYIPNNQDAAISIVQNADLGFANFSVTETSTHIIVCPSDYDEYDGPIYTLNKQTIELDEDYLASFNSNIKFAYGIGDYLIYSADDNYFIYDFSSAISTSLEVNGRRYTSRLIETENDIYFLPQRGFDLRLYGISKSNFNTNEISRSVYSIVDLTNENGSLYFSEPDNSGVDVRLYQYDISTGEKTQITSFERANIEAAAYYDDKVHVVGRIGEFVSSGGGQDFLSVINEGVLDTIKQVFYLNSNINPILATLGNKLYFSDGTAELGVELYSLDYGGVNTEDETLSSLRAFPNPTNNGQVYFDQRVDYITVTDIQGKTILRGRDLDRVNIGDRGGFVLSGILQDGTSFVERVVVK